MHTNMGRTLTAGGEAGHHNPQELPAGSYFVGFVNWSAHHHLTRLEFTYLDLDRLGINLLTDPIVSLITESELLSNGVEQ